MSRNITMRIFFSFKKSTDNNNFVRKKWAEAQNLFKKNDSIAYVISCNIAILVDYE